MLLDECKNIDERCLGYRATLIELVGDVLELEREHAIRKINIAQKIGDKVSAAGQYLYKKSNADASEQES